VIEASLSRVPLVVMTADRPPELHGWDAAQTIDQHRLFGVHARHQLAMPVGSFDPARAERTGVRAATVAATDPAGPVHINWPFREPLEPAAEWVEAASAAPAVAGAPRTWGVRDEWIDEVVALAAAERGLIVAGPRLQARERAGIVAFSEVTGWPILADALSGLRHTEAPGALVAADHLLKIPAFADSVVPEVVVRVGDSPTSKAYRLWMERHRVPDVLLIDPEDRWADPAASFTSRIAAPPGGLLGRAAARLEPRRERSWWDEWVSADAACAAAIAAELAGGPFCEPAATRVLLDTLGDGDPLHLASSMPVRDLDMFMPRLDVAPVLSSNRGANGIDGTVSTAAGIALGSGRRAHVLVGDLAFVHDVGGLVTAVRTGVHLTVVVLDNHGGGIFSLLPIADAAPSFEKLYGTPHDVDLAAAAAMAGARHSVASSAEALAGALGEARHTGGVTVVEVPVDRDANVAQLRRITAACGEALAGRR
jgi:2-succinyl-5-enolpyruvyl-6-hydroxy-3-cyclohexene-1-carboxylate synthase